MVNNVDVKGRRREG